METTEALNHSNFSAFKPHSRHNLPTMNETDKQIEALADRWVALMFEQAKAQKLEVTANFLNVEDGLLTDEQQNKD